MRIVNVAHGSFYMIGAFIAASPLAAVDVLGANAFWLKFILAPIVAGALGLVVEVLVLRRLYAREHVSQLLATFALFYIFADLSQEIWGNQYRSIGAPAPFSGQVVILDRVFPGYSFFVLGVTLLVGLLLFALLRFTVLGWRVRAAAEDVELLSGTGTNVALLSTGVFVLGTFLAGIAGAVVAPLQAVSPGMDANILVSAFIVAIVGGLGSVAGAALGSLILGLFQAFAVALLPSWSSMIVYLVMILLLAFRPEGLLGTSE
jgi:branched-subunit amino acid ABC-type transport system permease component